MKNSVKIRDGEDVNSIMHDMMGLNLEVSLDEELDEELGYSKYDLPQQRYRQLLEHPLSKDHAYQLWGYGTRHPQGPQKQV